MPLLKNEAPSWSSLQGAQYTQREQILKCKQQSYAKKFQKSTINICFVVSNSLFAPYIYIELPVGSSRRELHF